MSMAISICALWLCMWSTEWCRNPDKRMAIKTSFNCVGSHPRTDNKIPLWDSDCAIFLDSHARLNPLPPLMDHREDAIIICLLPFSCLGNHQNCLIESEP
ncbi:hypothetical protein V6N13_027777 [Hibiscus sabdariffa]